MNRTALLLALGLFLVAGVATADIPPPAQTACSGKKIGEACSLRGGDSGTCQKTTCSRSRPGPGGKIVTHTRDCTLCLPPAEKKEDDKKDDDKPDEKKGPGVPPVKTNDAGVSGPMSMGLGGGALVLGVFGAWAMRRRE